MICKKCLKKVDDDAQFCNWCGNAFTTTYSTNTNYPRIEEEPTTEIEQEDLPDIDISSLPKGYVTKVLIVAGIKQAFISGLSTFGAFFVLALIFSVFGVCLTSRGGECLNNIWDLFAIPMVLGVFAFIGVGWNTLKVIYEVYFPPKAVPMSEEHFESKSWSDHFKRGFKLLGISVLVLVGIMFIFVIIALFSS
jgi:hypothetical protein